MSVLAVTGGTGFVGTAVLREATARGHSVRALTRRPQPPRDGIEWVPGTLAEALALDRLVRGADAVLHIAGVVNAPDRAGFAEGNIAGTEAVLRAAHDAGTAGLVHVSSLSAREPDLSIYGWSKAEGDVRVRASDIPATIVRPPAIYGPGDHEMLQLFRMAARGIVPLPPAGRFSAIHVDDLARLLVTLAERPVPGTLFEVDDATPCGWSHVAFARAIGQAVGRTRVLPVSMPRAALMVAARIDRALRGDKAQLTPDRARYFSHPDWTVDPACRPPANLWQPRIATPDGLRETARWYRAQGLL